MARPASTARKPSSLSFSPSPPLSIQSMCDAAATLLHGLRVSLLPCPLPLPTAASCPALVHARRPHQRPPPVSHTLENRRRRRSSSISIMVSSPPLYRTLDDPYFLYRCVILQNYEPTRVLKNLTLSVSLAVQTWLPPRRWRAEFALQIRFGVGVEGV
ncbi:Glutathione S-transferase TCHQD [Zea mays]|uniref:Glutathione S-transferase TCHQD n=1 Tax=Zea mays TaxID=4577 RepID=A0A1D6EAB5_MAIZE|nr:Glutathione S-transferase TCHQD [Zea mays]ONM17320.1 Glutathione S-transferase TCHQD [Zea mays]